MEKRVVLSDERDLPLLQFLWTWKLAPSAVLAARFFSNTSRWAAYNRLNDLERAGHIISRCNETGRNPVWMLTKKGYAAIRFCLPALKEEGFKSESIRHDLIASAVQLGDWLVKEPEGVRFFSEQQLRRYEPEFYFSWVPKTDRHRPDGYWRIPTGGEAQTLALEVELTPKSNVDYQALGDFYGDAGAIDGVLWIVPSEATAVRIQRAFGKCQTLRTKIHHFSTLNAFQKNGWLAPLTHGPKAGQTIQALLEPPSGWKGVGNALNRVWNSNALLFFDTRKCSFHSASQPSGATSRETEMTTTLS